MAAETSDTHTTRPESGITGPGPGATAPSGGNGRPWPAWLAVPTRSVSDLLMLAGLRFDLDRTLFAAGVIDAVGWILETGPAPGSRRAEGPQSRAVALCELCAAEHHASEATGRPMPPLRAVCERLGVAYVPALTGAPDYGLGAWATLGWALGTSDEEPMRLPLRGPDGHLLGVEEILPTVLSTGMDPARARAQAVDMAEDTRRLAGLVRLKAAAPL